MATNNMALEVRGNGGTDIVRREADELVNIQQLGTLLAASGFFSDAREMAQAAVKVMAGRELGIPPVAAMMGINIIKGKVALGGNLIASRIRAHGYDFRHKRFDGTGCVLEFLSRPDANGKRLVLGESSFTEADAAKAQIKSDMYQKYPRNMYFNRAISNGAKWYCAEVFAGSPVYTPEELGAEVDEEGEIIRPEEKPKAERKTRVKQETPPVSAPPVAAPKEDTSEAPFVASNDDLPPELGGPTVPDPAPPAQTNGTSAPLKNYPMLQAFAAIKKALIAAGGSEADYYEALRLGGVKHSNEFSKVEDGRACYRLLESRLAMIQGGGQEVAA